MKTPFDILDPLCYITSMTQTLIRNYEYRIYPNATQRRVLFNTLRVCKDLYNACLERRKTLYETTGKGMGVYTQIKERATYGIDLSSVYSQVTQNVCARVDNAFKGFFRRVKHGEKPGYPRFKSLARYDSFTYPQSGFKILDKHVVLSKIGTVKIKKHRELPEGSKIKTCTVRKNCLNQWFVVLSIEIPTEVVNTTGNDVVGIDVGCESFLTLSTGEKLEHPHLYKKFEKRLANAQAKYAKLKQRPKVDKAKRKAKYRKNKLYTKVKNQRKDFLHKLSRELVNRFDTLYVEDLNIKGMLKDNWRNLNKSICDSGWGYFIQYLAYKAEEAGKKVVKVNPAYTSQICSGCGYMVKKELSVRRHKCPSCGLDIDRDVNAAINILSFGTKLSNENVGKSL